jgi:hypothetical protein
MLLTDIGLSNRKEKKMYIRDLLSYTGPRVRSLGNMDEVRP